LIQLLNATANNLFDTRANFRHLVSVLDGTRSDFSGLAALPSEMFPEATKLSADLGDLDRQIGEVARSCERVARAARLFAGGPKSAASSIPGNEAKDARFEAGKPADPTENMTPEDAAKWKTEHEKHKDNFTKAADHVFPHGARVLVDGRDEAIVKQAFPQGSTSYMFPHYKLDIVDGDKNVAVAMNRVGVDRKKAAAMDFDTALAQVKRTLTMKVINPLKGLSRLTDDGVFTLNHGEQEQNFKIPGMVNEALDAAQGVMSGLLLVDGLAQTEGKTAASWIHGNLSNMAHNLNGNAIELRHSRLVVQMAGAIIDDLFNDAKGLSGYPGYQDRQLGNMSNDLRIVDLGLAEAEKDIAALAHRLQIALTL
jgi:hypothetical protein